MAEFKATLRPLPTASSIGGVAHGSRGQGTSSGSGSLVAGPSGVVPTPPRTAPLVDPAYLQNIQQLCDMGFERHHADEALQACGNDLSSAMEWILAHPPSAPVEVVSLFYTQASFNPLCSKIVSLNPFVLSINQFNPLFTLSVDNHLLYLSGFSTSVICLCVPTCMNTNCL